MIRLCRQFESVNLVSYVVEIDGYGVLAHKLAAFYSNLGKLLLLHSILVLMMVMMMIFDCHLVNTGLLLRFVQLSRYNVVQTYWPSLCL